MIVLTVDPLLAFGLTVVRPWVMSKVCSSYSCTQGNIQVKVLASSNVLDLNGIVHDSQNLDDMIRAYTASVPVTVFGYSRGCAVAGEWMRRYATTGPYPDMLSFILIGNNERGVTHGGNTGRYLDGSPLRDTPNNTQYKVFDVARQGDWFANPPADRSFFSIPMAMFTHCNYWGVDLRNPDVVSREDVGNTTYLVVR